MKRRDSLTTPTLSMVKALFATVALIAALAISSLAAEAPPPERVKLTRLDDRVRIEIGGKLFSEYLFQSGTKPCLYPILDAEGTSYTRDWPLRTDTKEERDHDWHRSVFFGHGLVNGHDFWRAIPGTGRILHDGVVQQSDGATGLLQVKHRWEAANGETICTDVTTIRIQRVADGYFLDHEVAIKPSHGPLLLGDTEEGTLAVRVNEALRLSHGKGKEKTKGTGHIVNAAGQRDGATWGKRAPWCDYSGVVDGKAIGITIFDHPANPRPTWWHVRDYGLFAANPFGQHDFEKQKEQPHLGDLSVPTGGELVLRHRIFFHHGNEESAHVAERFRDYLAGK